MAKTQLTKNTTTGNWELTETNQSQNYTNTLLTAGLPVEGNIKIDITTKSGTAGTPIATKGTVSSNSITVTPSVTNTEGYILGGTKTGTGVTVNASELVSGNKQLTQATSTDITNYATATVRSATASMPSSLSGTSATASLSGTTLTLTKNLTNTATVTTAGWLSSLTGTTSVSLSGTVPTDPTITVTPSTETQTITPTSGKLLSSVIVNAIPKKAYTFVSNDYTTSSNYFYCSGEFELRVYNGTNWASSGVYNNKAFRVKSISTSNKTTILTYEICETIESTSMFDATQHTLSVTGSSSTGTAKFVTSDGAAQRFSSSSYSETSNIDNSSSYTGTTPHSFHLIKMYAYISAFGSSKSKTIYIRANYVRSFSGSNSSGTVYNNANARTSLEYSTDGSTWTQASCYVSVSGSGSGTASGSHHIKNIYWSYMENVMFNELI